MLGLISELFCPRRAAWVSVCDASVGKRPVVAARGQDRLIAAEGGGEQRSKLALPLQRQAAAQTTPNSRPPPRRKKTAAPSDWTMGVLEFSQSLGGLCAKPLSWFWWSGTECVCPLAAKKHHDPERCLVLSEPGEPAVRSTLLPEMHPHAQLLCARDLRPRPKCGFNGPGLLEH